MPTQRVHQRKYPAHKVPAGPNLDQSGTLVRDLLMQHESELAYLNSIFMGEATGVLDHGSLSGLGDDDHTQYLLLATTRGTQTVASAVTWTGLQTFRDNAVKITDESDITKTLAWSLGGATAGADLLLIWSGTADRSITYPNATTTLAGLAVAQTFIKANTFTPDSDVTNITLNNLSGQTNPFLTINDVDTGNKAFEIRTLGDPGGLPGIHVPTFSFGLSGLFIWASGQIGVGTGIHRIATNATSTRTLTLPNISGTALLSAAKLDGAARTTAIAATQLLAAAAAPAGVYQVNVYAECTVAGAGSLAISWLWTDDVAAVDQIITTLDMSTTGHTNQTFTFRQTGAANLRYKTVFSASPAGSGTYILYLRLNAL